MILKTLLRAINKLEYIRIIETFDNYGIYIIYEGVLSNFINSSFFNQYKNKHIAEIETEINYNFEVPIVTINIYL